MGACGHGVECVECVGCGVEGVRVAWCCGVGESGCAASGAACGAAFEAAVQAGSRAVEAAER